jgi:pimeloyl-ACP methyl ester carboxylesterase
MTLAGDCLTGCPRLGPASLRVSRLGILLAGERWAVCCGTPRGTVILLHGGGQTRGSWVRTARALAGCGWNAVLLDARGHGESGWDSLGDYSLSAMAADLRTVVLSLGVDPILVGASMGGLTSLIAAGESWVDVRALVLVDVVPRVEPGGVQRIRDFMTSQPNGYDTLEQVADAVRGFSRHRRQPSVAGLRRNVRRREDGRLHWHWDPKFLPSTDPDSVNERYRRTLAAAREVTVPTLLLRGEHSDIVSDDGVAELRQAIPHARCETVAGVGHMIAGDDNDVFVAHLADFFAEQCG